MTSPTSDPFARHRAALDRPDAPDLLTAYFGETDGHPWFHGARFEGLDGGGDATDVSDRVTASDLVAVRLLWVDVPPDALIRLLGDGAPEFTAALRAIPTDVDPTTAVGQALLTATDSPLVHVWRRIATLDGVGPVTAGKLLSRKRPHLVPIADDVDIMTLPDVATWCRVAAEAFTDGRLVDRIDEVRGASGAPGWLGRLRVLDIVTWMAAGGTSRLPSDHPLARSATT